MLNIRHTEDGIEAVIKIQKETIFPLLKQWLNGDEKLILNFGCRPGRFTPALAEMTPGMAIGVDPIQHFLDLAPRDDHVEYREMQEGIIPVDDASIDVIWICIVMGGIIDQGILQNTISEIDRILKKDGFIFLIENTSTKKDGSYWKFRTIEAYQALFGFVKLKHLSDYFDMGERISIMAGRKYV